MALTVANINSFADDTWGRHRVRLVTVTFDNSYPTGGESFTPADVGLAEIVAVFQTNLDGWLVNWDRTAQKLVVHGQVPTSATTTTIPLTEADSTEDLSTLDCRLLVIGH